MVSRRRASPGPPASGKKAGSEAEEHGGKGSDSASTAIPPSNVKGVLQALEAALGRLQGELEAIRAGERDDRLADLARNPLGESAGPLALLPVSPGELNPSESKLVEEWTELSRRAPSRDPESESGAAAASPSAAGGAKSTATAATTTPPTKTGTASKKRKTRSAPEPDGDADDDDQDQVTNTDAAVPQKQSSGRGKDGDGNASDDVQAEAVDPSSPGDGTTASGGGSAAKRGGSSKGASKVAASTRSAKRKR